MYSKDCQTSSPNNPSFYRQRRTNNNDNTHRHQEAQSTSTNTSRNDRKQDYIVQNFYSKVAQIVIQSRISLEKSVIRQSSQKYSSSPYSVTDKDAVRKRVNGWFNLITTDIDGLKDELKYWRHQIAKVADRTPYPMIIDIFLDTSKMADDMTLMFVNNRGIHRPVNTIGTHGGKIHSVLLESWILQLKSTLTSDTVDLPNLYKKSIIFFRSLHSFVRLLPTYQLRDRLKVSDSGLTLGYRLRKNNVQRFDEISYDTPLTNMASSESEYFEFADILTPIGALNLCVRHRKECAFYAKPVVRDIATLETAIEDWQVSKQARRGYVKTDEPDWPLPSFVPSINSQRYSSSPTSSISSSFSYEESSTTTSLSYRRPSTPIVSPFKSKSLSSSYGTGSPQMKLMDPYHAADPTVHKTFSSSFERYYNNKTGNREDDDNTSLSGKRESRVSLLSIESNPNNSATIYSDDDDLSQFMGIVDRKHDLKMFRRTSLRSPSGYEDGDQDACSESGSLGKSKAALSRFQYMKSSHMSLSESLSSSNTSSRPLSTTQSTTENNLTASISSMSSIQSREQSLSSSGASHNFGTDAKLPTPTRTQTEAKRASFANIQSKSSVADEGTNLLSDSSNRTRRMQVSPPLVDRYPFKQPRQASRQPTQNQAASAFRGNPRGVISGQYAESLGHFMATHDDDDPLIFTMNDMEHN
ncbi:hypothetical protein K450DRAFT_236183 [Umbelopsis ramanniana AG]|uniref:Autophagy-related protein 13 n=1 Tax=Umbelopsis ramanniana AG TaxID=1314678 RepID=A0AAD5EE16_UMBRA|nr:uncharacterized protein K450DRAFT_236183 [Umbelopsis ramanniana AG]KAI8580555.1 hypothetical protein K450DRAFT_236183 [Umbelopsis ramanniana AG]